MTNFQEKPNTNIHIYISRNFEWMEKIFILAFSLMDITFFIKEKISLAEFLIISLLILILIVITKIYRTRFEKAIIETSYYDKENKTTKSIKKDIKISYISSNNDYEIDFP